MHVPENGSGFRVLNRVRPDGATEQQQKQVLWSFFSPRNGPVIYLVDQICPSSTKSPGHNLSHVCPGCPVIKTPPFYCKGAVNILVRELRSLVMKRIERTDCLTAWVTLKVTRCLELGNLFFSFNILEITRTILLFSHLSEKQLSLWENDTLQIRQVKGCLEKERWKWTGTMVSSDRVMGPVNGSSS